MGTSDPHRDSVVPKDAIELEEFAPGVERPYAAPLRRLRGRHIELLLAIAQGESVAEAARRYSAFVAST